MTASATTRSFTCHLSAGPLPSFRWKTRIASATVAALRAVPRVPFLESLPGLSEFMPTGLNAMPLNVADTMGRSMRDLRISVTDRCNFRCPYCMPAEIFGEAYEFLPREEILTFEEIARLTRLFAEFGVSKARITGGEPLLPHRTPRVDRPDCRRRRYHRRHPHHQRLPAGPAGPGTEGLRPAPGLPSA